MPESHNVSDELVNPLPVGDVVIGRVKISDGAEVADVLDQGTSNGLAVVVLDGSGDPVTSFGGGDASAANQSTMITALQLIDNIVNSIIGPGAPTIDSYGSVAVNLTAGADQVLIASAANKQIWVYGFGFSVNVAGTVSFQDQDDVAITGIMQVGITGGFSHSPSGNFSMPIWKLGTDKDLEVDVVTAELDGWISYAIVSV